jgi:hypothetical protein
VLYHGQTRDDVCEMGERETESECFGRVRLLRNENSKMRAHDASMKMA